MFAMKSGLVLVGLVSAIAGCQAAAPRPRGGADTILATTTSSGDQDRRQSRTAPGGGEAAPSVQVVAADPIEPPTGHACRVYLRRDALGMAGAAPLAPNLDAPIQRGTVVSGTLDQVTESWIVLKSNAGRIWVPRHMVLMLEMSK